MDYAYLADLHAEFEMPVKGIHSQIIHKDQYVNVTLFGFAPGEELSAHSSPTPAVLYFLDGQSEVTAGTDKLDAHPGSFVYLTPSLPHAIAARTPVRMLLVQVKRS